MYSFRKSCLWRYSIILCIIKCWIYYDISSLSPEIYISGCGNGYTLSCVGGGGVEGMIILIYRLSDALDIFKETEKLLHLVYCIYPFLIWDSHLGAYFENLQMALRWVDYGKTERLHQTTRYTFFLELPWRVGFHFDLWDLSLENVRGVKDVTCLLEFHALEGLDSCQISVPRYPECY